MSRPSIQLGLRANWRQFALLMLVNAFVGAMLGLERTVVPLIASQEFGLASVSVSLSFIVSFGLVKALANLTAGRYSDRAGRKPFLVAGWLIGLPVPLLIIAAPRWEWIVLANVLLGVNQGLCWSTAVIMKIDLAGPARRGLAMGLNEFTGYLAMALSTMLSGWIAAQTALRPYPFYLGIVFAAAGLLVSFFLIRETRPFARHESAQRPDLDEAKPLSFAAIFRRVSWQDKGFFSLSQGGLVNNLNDVVIWGLLPLLAVRSGIGVDQAAALGGTYLAVWGAGQLATGPLSDRMGRKRLITAGLFVQSLGIILFVLAAGRLPWLLATVLMGLGTAMVYPTLLAAVGDLAHPSWRASAVGVYRLWRDGGYAAGALLAGLLSDAFTVEVAIAVIAGLTLASAGVTAVFLPETHATRPKPRRDLPDISGLSEEPTSDAPAGQTASRTGTG
ncbi:MAG: MFS transporter [Chloroflexi bacterium]|nr:MFS transporter [Chloroflexota bacterium]